jgi:DNA-binding beta-propeller fold protein YncE
MPRALLFFLAITLSATASGDILGLFGDDDLTDGSRFAFVPSKSDQTIIAIDTQDHDVAATIKISHVAGSVIATNELDLLVATNPDAESITVINLYNKEVIRELNIGMRPDVVLANAYDRFVTFGSKDGSISTWDLSNFQQVVRVDDLSSALLLTFSFDGGRLFVVEPEEKKISVIDMAKRAKAAEISLGTGDDAEMQASAISRSADGYTGYVSIGSEDRVVVIDLVKLEVKGSIRVGAGPIRPFSTSDNQFVLVPNQGDQTLSVIASWSQNVVATIPTGIQAREVNTGWLDTVAFVMPAEGKEMAVIDLQNFKAMDSIRLPGRTDDGIVTSDSKTLVASVVETGEVAVADARSGKLITLIDTGTSELGGIEIAVSNNVCH